MQFGEGAKGQIRVTSGRNGHRTKGGKSRFVPMTRRLASAMREHFAQYRFAQYDGESTPWVLHHEFTRRHHEAGARIRSLHAAFQSAAKHAKLPAGLHQHDLRHRRVTEWLAGGQSPVTVMHAMGHSDIKTTMGYYRFVSTSSVMPSMTFTTASRAICTSCTHAGTLDQLSRKPLPGTCSTRTRCL